ncbi:ABC transporter substrate-binding protein [Bradyrhizobium sp. BR 10289]|uniref:ABC transporter substrate-binding protein n=1 Tax=Bradyrhizobium sp. BR 10289 TaxID=2749993 RepID=UPI001C647612|nr:ABC transporter substrate-binding protein [Bradyrhizobium sp. BR 10289]MBW7971553.1 ABC transporter substrate-binding protein [Bradyrhizobium sp. BR 10289]
MIAHFATDSVRAQYVLRYFIACVGALFLAQPTSGALAAGPEATSINLQFSGSPDVSLAGVMMASKLGFFAQQGLSVKLQSLQGRDGGTDDTPSIVISIQNARDFMIARASGVPLVAIAGNYVDSSAAFFFRRKKNIRSEQDLAGKSVGYDANSDTGLIFEWFLTKNSVARSSLTEVPVNPGAKGILDDKIDVILGHSGVENLIFEKAGLDYGTLDPRAYGVHALGTVYVVDEISFRQNPDALIRFLRALIAGWDYTYAKPDQAIEEIASVIGGDIDRSMLKRALERQREFIRPGGARFGEALRNRWNDLYIFMTQHRMIKAPIDLSKATDTKLLAEAYRARLGSANSAD